VVVVEVRDLVLIHQVIMVVLVEVVQVQVVVEEVVTLLQ
jgi:hypothetical protein